MEFWGYFPMDIFITEYFLKQRIWNFSYALKGEICSIQDNDSSKQSSSSPNHLKTIEIIHNKFGKVVPLCLPSVKTQKPLIKF